MNLRQSGLIGSAIGALCLLGCSKRHETVVAARPPQAPPRLWLIEVTGEPGGGRAIRLCADDHLVSGFASITPEIEGQSCSPEEIPSQAVLNSHYKCKIGEREFGVSTVVTGSDPARFVASSSVVDLDARSTVYRRSLSFLRLGSCPAGWAVGAATDQQGHRVQAAFVGGGDLPYKPQ